MTPFNEKIRRAIEDYVGPSMAQDMIVEAAAQVAIEEIECAYHNGYNQGVKHRGFNVDTIKNYLQSRGIAQAESAAQKCNCEFPKYNGTTCSKCDLPY